MLNELQIQCISDFFHHLEDAQVVRITSSVLKGKIRPNSKAEAITLISMHTSSVSNVFFSRKVTETMLRNYLLKHGIPTDISASKMDLLNTVLSGWNLQNSDGKNMMEHKYPQMSGTNVMPNNAMAVPIRAQISGSSQLNMGGKHMIQQNSNQLQRTRLAIATNFGAAANSQQCMWSDTAARNDNNNNNNNRNEGTYSVTSSHIAPMQSNHSNHASFQVDMAGSTATSFNSQTLSHEAITSNNGLMFNQFVVDFARSYYMLLNQTVPDTQAGLNSGYLFEDCSMDVVVCFDATVQNKEHAVGISNVVNMLKELKKQFDLHFEPNLTEHGVRGKIDVHGLIFAVACGTLHQGIGKLVGMFEQSFILRRDPFSDSNSCKIVKSTLILRNSTPVSSMMGLPSNDAANDHMLTYDVPADGNTSPASNTPVITEM